jgi:LPS sulfotransferase NodH
MHFISIAFDDGSRDTWEIMRHQMKFQPFVITSLPRSGSFMLTTTLDSHPGIRCAGETLSRFQEAENQPYKNAAEVLMSRVYSPGSGIKAAGFKLLFQDAREGRFTDAREFLVQLPVKVIHLRRRNLLKRYVSFLHAEKTDVWILCDENERPGTHRFKVDIDELIMSIKDTLRSYDKMDREFFSCHSLTVWYEDLVNEYTREMNRIFSFLKVNSAETKPETIRQETRELSEIISNYDEIKAALANTPWSGFLY